MRARSATFFALLALALVATNAAAQRVAPTPASVIGFDPGADRKLPKWSQVVDYFTALSKATPRVQMRVLGKTTLGRPFIAAFIADSATLANLPKYRDMQRKLADPRLQSAGERQRLLADEKVVVLVTSSIHSTEVGGILTPMRLAYQLATREDADAKSIRANAITILVPSLNPDGVDIVGDWYRGSLGTAYEGSQPPELYHHYTGHDNNRDWYAFTQVETQMVIDSLYGQWHPQIVNDIHQQGSNGTRIFIPPYMDPIEPNIDPILMAGVAQMGKAMTWRLTAQGLVGVANNTSYDAWTPARAYQHYHGAIRILTETASADLASPITVPFDSLRAGYNVDPKSTGVDFLTLWNGGRWTIGDIVNYQTAASMALLTQAANDRGEWLSSFAMVEEHAVKGKDAPGRAGWPVAFVIPADQQDPAALSTVLRILQRGQVEVRKATAPVTADSELGAGAGMRGSTQYPAGSYVVFTAQPYGAFAKALLERQRYPDLHEYPGGPPKRPYDVTAHTLPLLMGVRVGTVTSGSVATGEPIAPVAKPTLSVPGLSGSTRRIAMYKSYSPSMDEGWTRYIFDTYHVPYVSVHDRDLRGGNLKSRFDVVILPDARGRSLARGATGAYPDSLKGGIGETGAQALRDFVEAGGTLVAFNNASLYAADILKLPVKNVLEGIPPKEFYAPGSIMRVNLNRASPIGAAVAAQPMVWFEDSPAFDITDPSRATAIASYPDQGDPLLSGWLLGGSKLNGKAAAVDVKQGAGHVILFGFRPQYRAQTIATYPMLWAALK